MKGKMPPKGTHMMDGMPMKDKDMAEMPRKKEMPKGMPKKGKGC